MTCVFPDFPAAKQIPKWVSIKDINSFKYKYNHTYYTHTKNRGKRVYLRFFLQAFFLPPVARLLCIESLEIPDITNKTVGIPWEIEKYIYTHKKACFFLVYVWILRKWRISNIQKFHQIIERIGYRRSYPSWPRSEVLSLSLSLSMLKPWLSGLKYETLVLFHAISRRGCFCHFSFYFKKEKKKKFLHFYYSNFNFWAGREIFVHG